MAFTRQRRIAANCASTMGASSRATARTCWVSHRPARRFAPGGWGKDLPQAHLLERGREVTALGLLPEELALEPGHLLLELSDAFYQLGTLSCAPPARPAPATARGRAAPVVCSLPSEVPIGVVNDGDYCPGLARGGKGATELSVTSRAPMFGCARGARGARGHRSSAGILFGASEAGFDLSIQAK